MKIQTFFSYEISQESTIYTVTATETFQIFVFNPCFVLPENVFV